MIELSPSTAFMLYLGLTLAAVLGLWAYQHFDSRKSKLTTTDQRIYICEYCHFVYLAEHAKKITQCPQCQSHNKDNALALNKKQKNL